MIATEPETLTLERFKPLDPPRRLLFGPGPSMVHPRVYQAMCKPVVGHLDPYFFQVMEDVQTLLQPLFGTQSGFTVVISGTGSAGMESAVSNFVGQGTRFAVFANGYFSDRICEMGRRQGGEVVRLEKPWGEIYGDEEARQFILREQPKVVAYVQAETSTGTFQPGQAICDAAHQVGALVIADCVTSLGAMPVNAEETGIDVAYSCSQKALSCPPGLAPITLSAQAAQQVRTRKTVNRSWYLDLKLIDEYYTSAHRYHHTAPISMFYALREALIVIAEEGLERRWERHRRAHNIFVKGIETLGLKMLVAPGQRIWNLNTVRVPDGVDDAKVRSRLLREHGIEILGGFGPLAGKIFRIGIMGALATEESVRDLLARFGDALRAEGYRC